MLQKILLLLILLLLGWLTPPLQAQFKYYPTEQNFYNNHSIRGNHVWQATQNGVLLRDLEGNLIQHITPRNSEMPRNQCQSVYEEADGTLWITYLYSGISRLKNGVWTYWDNQTSILGIYAWTGLVQENNGNIWATEQSINGLLFRFDGNEWAIIPKPIFGLDSLQSGAIFDLQADKLGRIHVVTNLGIARWEGNDWITSPITPENETKINFNAENELFSKSENGEFSKWSEDFSNHTLEFIISPQEIYFAENFIFDANNVLWIPPFIWSDSTLIRIPDIYLDGNKSISLDSLGNIWITNGLYLLRYDGTNWKSFHSGFVLQSSPDVVVKSDDTHHIWMTSGTGIISRYNTQTGQFNYYDQLTPELFPYGTTNHLCTAKNGEAWAFFRKNHTINQLLHFTDNGIEVLTDSTTNFGLPNSEIKILETDAENRLWLSAKNNEYYFGLTLFDGQVWKTFHQGNSPLLSNKINDLERGASNDMWVATDTALLHYKNGNWSVFMIGVNGMPNAAIKRLSLAPDGSIWLCFPNAIAQFKEGIWKVFDQNTGGFNTSGVLKEIEVDWQNQVWVSAESADLNSIIQRFNGYNWQIYRYFPDFNLGDAPNDIETDADGTVWFLTSYTIFSSQNLDKWVLGNVFNDQNLNCLRDTLETGIGTRIVIAENTETAEKEYALSNIDGNFLFNLDSATYKIYASTTNSYWEDCAPPTTIDFGQVTTDSTQIALGLTADFDCPRMTVSVAASALRRCFDNTYYVQYCNNGTAIAENVSIDLSFDDDFLVQSSSLTPTSQTASSLHFELGTVDVGACGGFSVVLNLQCDSAQINERRCVKALVFPDSFCNTLPQWSGAEIQVEGVCTGDSVRFTIKNTGSAPSQSLDYVIIDEHVISREGNFQLDPAEIKVESILADGSPFRLEAEQEPFYPVASFPSFTVEGCGPNPTSGFGFQYPEDDASPFVDWECRDVTGSFDPNDKTGFPQGYADAHYIFPKTEIEYLIRFQNTGNDTAFNIVVRDTLHSFLEPTSIQAEASSHPYIWKVDENGVLSFYFNDILLPDSTTNLLGSQGFVRFRIAHKADISLGSVIPNSAAIFFDFNAPIITNETWHTVDTGFLEKNIPTISISDKPNEYNLLLQVSPNPVDAGEFIYFEKLKTGFYQFFLRNALGQVVCETNLIDNKLKLPQNLVSGSYFFEIKNIGKGKLVVK
jgi:streptogramin lyase